MKISVFFISILLAFIACKKEELPTDLNEQVDRIVKPYIFSGSRVGIAVGIYDNGNQNMFFYGSGNIESGSLIDENTMFEIGSITKTLTSVIMAEMELEGKLDRNDKLQFYLPSFVAIPTYKGQEIKLLHLSNQTSALPYMPDDFNVKQLPPPMDTYSEEHLWAYIKRLELNRAPGEKYEYSNIGPGILGYVLSNIDSSGYFEMVKKRVLIPLNMNSTYIDFNDAPNGNIATGYVGNKIMEPWKFNEIWMGSGALKSNLKDMMKYLKANIETSSDNLGLAFSKTHNKTFSGEYDMGLAWFISKLDDGQEIIWHNGGTGGFSSIIGFNTTTKKGVVILTNTQSGQENEIFIAQEIMKSLNEH